jgi:two-component system cell cycle sensor histidine kinase/response regulator CckA
VRILTGGVESKLGMNDRMRTVLIVDDDPQILRLVEKMLRPRNVNVLLAPRPTEALLICQQQAVHLLISDVLMPEMDGNKLAERVLKLHPEASVLLISGHYKEPAAGKAGQIKFLKKPFFPSQLIQFLQELLPEA